MMGYLRFNKWIKILAKPVSWKFTSKNRKHYIIIRFEFLDENSSIEYAAMVFRYLINQDNKHLFKALKLCGFNYGKHTVEDLAFGKIKPNKKEKWILVKRCENNLYSARFPDEEINDINEVPEKLKEDFNKKSKRYRFIKHKEKLDIQNEE